MRYLHACLPLKRRVHVLERSDMGKQGALKTREAARFLGVSESMLRQSRSRARRCQGPPYAKIGGAVVYRVEDLIAYLEQHKVDVAAVS